MTPSLSRFIADFGALSHGYLLPAAARRRWRHWLGLLPSAAGAALGTAVLLVGASTLLVRALLGPERLSQVFPYLQPALEQFLRDRHWLIALILTLVSLGGLVLQLGAMALPLRRRWLALAALLSLLVLTTAVDVAFTEGNGAVMDALNRRNAGAFWGTAAGLVTIYLLTLPIQFLNTYGQQRFALAWRDASTSSMERGYLQGLTYYRLEAEAELVDQIDNPDQRIAEDIQRSVASSTDLAFGFSASLLALAAYIVVLIGISSTLVITLLIATLIGNGLIVKLVRRLAGLNFRQQALEAEFRFALVHIRNNAEKIAFLRGEQPIAVELRRRFSGLLFNLERLIRWRALVDQSTSLYAFLMQFVPYLVLSVAYFAGRVSLGQLTVASIAFGQVQSSLSFLIDRADSFAGLFASLERIGGLSRVVGNGLETIPTPVASAPALHLPRLGLNPNADQRLQDRSAGEPQINPAAGAEPGPPLLRLEGVTVTQATNGQALIRQLDLVIEPGDRLLITGPSGCGKTSLLRVLADLVPAAAGSMRRGDGLAMLVLPQAPYMSLGSLREQILFPGVGGNGGSDEPQLRAILRRVRLESLEQRHPDLDEITDWSRVLSGGEQQRLGFARLLLHQPDLAVLDEATSALDLASEAQLYGDLVDRGCAVISVGHRPSLRAFHQRELRLDGEGGWSLQPIR